MPTGISPSPENASVTHSTPRMDILRGLRDRGPSSIKEIAVVMGRPADGLYYHFKLLINSGHIKKHESRQTTRRQEAVYKIAASITIQKGTDENLETAAEILLRTASKEYEKSAWGDKSALPKKQLHRKATRRTAWLNEKELTEIELLLKSIEDLLKNSTRREETALYSVTHVLTPVETHPLRR